MYPHNNIEKKSQYRSYALSQNDYQITALREDEKLKLMNKLYSMASKSVYAYGIYDRSVFSDGIYSWVVYGNPKGFVACEEDDACEGFKIQCMGGADKVINQALLHMQNIKKPIWACVGVEAADVLEKCGFNALPINVLKMIFNEDEPLLRYGEVAPFFEEDSVMVYDNYLGEYVPGFICVNDKWLGNIIRLARYTGWPEEMVFILEQMKKGNLHKNKTITNKIDPSIEQILD